MIDTIKLVSNKYNYTNFGKDRIIEKYVEYPKPEKSYSLYRHRNMTIILSPNKMTIQGSITKHFLGHNLNFSLGSIIDVKNAIDKLSSEIGINLDNFRITRMDVGRCFTVQHPVKYYLQNLISLPRHSYIYYEDSGRSFKNSIRTITLYDKVQEVNNKSKRKNGKSGKKFLKILDLKDNNILRYELQIRNIKAELREGLKVSDLIRRNIYAKIIDKYISYFDKIKKQRVLQIDLTGKSGKEIDDILTIKAIMNYGYENFRKHLDHEISLNDKQKRGLQKYRKKICEKFSTITTSKLRYDIGNYINPSIWNDKYQQQAMLMDEEQELFNYIRDQVEKIKTASTTSSISFDKKWELNTILNNSDNPGIIAYQIIKEIRQYKSQYKLVNGNRHKTQDDGIKLAIYLFKQDHNMPLSEFLRRLWEDIHN